VDRKVEEEGVMDLGEAIKNFDGFQSKADFLALNTIIAAAKRELEREEKAPRRRLEELEEATRAASFKILPATYPDSDKAACRLYDRLHQAADILKALREVVIPGLRSSYEMARAMCKDMDPIEIKAGNLLRALGEEP
jgi:hypothetical protein